MISMHGKIRMILIKNCKSQSSTVSHLPCKNQFNKARIAFVLNLPPIVDHLHLFIWCVNLRVEGKEHRIGVRVAYRLGCVNSFIDSKSSWQHGNTKLSLSWNQSLKATSGSEWPMVVKKAKPRDGHTDKSKIIIVSLWLEIWIKIMQTFNLLHHSFLYWNQGTHCLHHQLRLDTATIQHVHQKARHCEI